jgi:hypothetical protein
MGADRPRAETGMLVGCLNCLVGVPSTFISIAPCSKTKGLSPLDDGSTKRMKPYFEDNGRTRTSH